MTKDINSIIESLTKNATPLDYIPVGIPSNGILYKNFKGVTMRPMGLEDEKVLAESKGGAREAINKLLARCLNGVECLDLLPIDRDYLLIKLRELSFGEEFKAVTACPKCNSDNNLSFILSKLPADPLPEDTKEPLEITLPKLEIQVKLLYPRVRDEVWLTPENIENSLWRFVESIKAVDSEEWYQDKEIIAGVMKKIPLADVHILLKAISLNMYGLQTKVKIKCPTCSKISIIDVPINQDFFTTTS